MGTLHIYIRFLRVWIEYISHQAFCDVEEFDTMTSGVDSDDLFDDDSDDVEGLLPDNVRIHKLGCRHFKHTRVPI